MAAPRWQWQQQSPNWQLLQGQSQQFPAFQQGAQSLVPVYCFQLSNGAQEGGCGPRVEFSGSQQSTAAESGPEFSGSKQSRAAESGPGFHRGYGEKISVGVQTTRFAEVGVQTDDIWPERSSEAAGAQVPETILPEMRVPDVCDKDSKGVSLRRAARTARSPERFRHEKEGPQDAGQSAGGARAGRATQRSSRDAPGAERHADYWGGQRGRWYQWWASDNATNSTQRCGTGAERRRRRRRRRGRASAGSKSESASADKTSTDYQAWHAQERRLSGEAVAEGLPAPHFAAAAEPRANTGDGGEEPWQAPARRHTMRAGRSLASPESWQRPGATVTGSTSPFAQLRLREQAEEQPCAVQAGPGEEQDAEAQPCAVQAGPGAEQVANAQPCAVLAGPREEKKEEEARDQGAQPCAVLAGPGEGKGQEAREQESQPCAVLAGPRESEEETARQGGVQPRACLELGAPVLSEGGPSSRLHSCDDSDGSSRHGGDEGHFHNEAETDGSDCLGEAHTAGTRAQGRAFRRQSLTPEGRRPEAFELTPPRPAGRVRATSLEGLYEQSWPGDGKVPSWPLAGEAPNNDEDTAPATKQHAEVVIDTVPAPCPGRDTGAVENCNAYAQPSAMGRLLEDEGILIVLALHAGLPDWIAWSAASRQMASANSSYTGSPPLRELPAWNAKLVKMPTHPSGCGSTRRALEAEVIAAMAQIDVSCTKEELATSSDDQLLRMISTLERHALELRVIDAFAGIGVSMTSSELATFNKEKLEGMLQSLLQQR